jgi:peptidoglycan/LPS O-acetylase OafA/YrhL
MIGTWRFLLAILVVIGHLYHPWWPATFGVFSFYIISGFLMTLVLNERYSFSAKGFLAFWINRFLRLYPPYYAGVVFSVLIIMLIPREFVTGINIKLTFPDEWMEYITNFSILGLENRVDRSSLVPSAWALSIELVYYFVISIWAGRSRRNGIIFLLGGALYLMFIHYYKDSDWWYRYFHVGAGCLPFAVGVNIYFHLDRIKRCIDRLGWASSLFISLSLYAACFLCAAVLGHEKTMFFYLNIITTSLLLPVLWVGVNVPIVKKLDARLGNLSYPIYLFHWQVGVLIAFITGFTWKSTELFMTAFFVVTALAWLESIVISGPVDRLRKRVRLDGRLAIGRPKHG